MRNASACSPSGRRWRWNRCSCGCLRGRSFRHCIRRGFLLGFSCFRGVREIFINRDRFGRMNFMVVFVRLRQILLALEQMVKAFAFTQLEFLVHLDRFERTNLDANLAAHADRNVDIEHLRVKLRFAHVIGLLVLALDDVDALRRTFLLANLARHAAQPRLLIVAVVNEKREIAVILRKRNTLFRILHRDQPLLVEITSDKVPRSDRHSLEYARADHRSTSPITISMLPRITITSATVWPRHRSSRTVRLMKLGGRTR